MKHGCFIAVALFALTASGCRNAHNHQLLYREMRLLEDQIYALEDENAHLESQLASAQRENASLRDEIDGGESEAPRRRRDSSEPTAPSIELPDLPTRREPDADAPSFTPDADEPSDAPPFDPGASGAIEDPNVNDVTFHRLLTGGYDADGRPGDDGLSVVLEPRNARGELVRTSGDVELALVDSERGDGGRVAQWKFTSAELSRTWERRTVGEGFFLELPWPNRPPDSRQLELIVTYRTPRGKRLIAEKQIAIDPAGGRFADWTESKSADDGARPVSGESARPSRQVQRAEWSPNR